MAKNDGGPAFPRTEHVWDGVIEEGSAGMSLRDYFAGQAILSLTMMPIKSRTDEMAAYVGVDEKDWVGDIHWPMLLAKRAYSVADAMLAERDKND